MKIICPQCDSDIPQQHINIEKNMFLCPACNEVFNLSAVMEQEEAAITGEAINNPPKGITVKKNFDELVVSIYTRAPGSVFLILFTLCFGGVSFFGLFAFLRTGIFGEGPRAGNIFFAAILLIFPLASLFLAAMTIYSIFGRIDLVWGNSTYIFRGVGNIGIKKYIDWKNVKEIYMHTSTDSEGSVSKSICIQGNETIKISTRFLNETKTRFLLSLLKYFRYGITAQHKNQKIID